MSLADMARQLKSSQNPFWLKIIGYFILPFILYLPLSIVIYPLKPDCSVGMGPRGCIPICEPVTFFEDGRPSSYRETPCYHEERSVELLSFIYENSDYFYPVILVILTTLFLYLNSVNKLEIISRIAFAPIYLIKENRKRNTGLKRLLYFIFLIFPIIIEWAFGYYLVLSMAIKS